MAFRTINKKLNLSFQEQGDQSGDSPITMVTQKPPFEDFSDELEADDIELPPPMEIQDHLFKPQESSPDDLAKMVGIIDL